MCKSAARDERVRIVDRGNDTLDTGIDQCVSTGRRLPVMIVGFERTVCGATPCTLTRLLGGDKLGMGAVVVGVRAFANDHAISGNYHAADKRIGTDKAEPAGREIKGRSCKLNVEGANVHFR